jgi:phosphoribosyl 1,2-cyclic phosphodiesterase
MLEGGSYPRMLKERISGRFGHLDNEAAAGIVSRIDCTRLEHIVAAHLSKENNRPELAAQALAGALGCEASWIGVASQEAGFAWRSIS